MLDSTKSHHVYLGSAVNKLTIKSALHFQKKRFSYKTIIYQRNIPKILFLKFESFYLYMALQSSSFQGD